MAEIDTGSIDAIICDLPYGTMKGINEKFEWDNIMQTSGLLTHKVNYRCFERVNYGNLQSMWKT